MSNPAPPAAIECSLDPRFQHCNLIIYASLVSLAFLAAPVIYVGFVQGALCKRLNTSDTVANLPGTVYLAMIWCPIVISWLFPKARQLRNIKTTTYSILPPRVR